MRVSPTNYPGVFKAALYMLADQGLSTRVRSVAVPDFNDIATVDRELQALSEEDLEALCIGDADEEMPAVLEKIGANGSVVHCYLDELFMMIGG